MELSGDGEDGLPPPPDMRLFEGLPRWAVLTIKATIGLTILGFVYLVLGFFRSAYTDWLWFSNLGLRSVFSTVLYTRVVLYLIGVASSAAPIYFAYRAAWRASWGPTMLPFSLLATTWIKRSIIIGASVMGAVIVLSFAAALADRWEVFLRFWNSTTFGIDDPQFGNDVGFYVFTLPMLHSIQGWLLGLAIVVLITTVGLYLLVYSARGINPVLTERAKVHLAVVGAALMVTIAAGLPTRTTGACAKAKSGQKRRDMWRAELVTQLATIFHELDEDLRRGRGGPTPARQARASFTAPRQPVNSPGLSNALVAGAGAQPPGGSA